MQLLKNDSVKAPLDLCDIIFVYSRHVECVALMTKEMQYSIKGVGSYQIVYSAKF